MLNSTVTVIGGLTMDLSYYVDSWPKVKEAVQATSYILAPGGKGLNQATAMARMGLKVNLISSIGNDSFSDKIFSALKEEKINNINVLRHKNVATDLVGIIIGPDGQPGFIGIRDASFKLTVNDIKQKGHLIKESSILMVNSEVSGEIALMALKIAKENNITTIFNPSPPDFLPEGILKYVDWFVLNEWEAKVLIRNPKLSASELAKKYYEMGAKIACVTLGENGCVAAANKGIKSFETFSIDEVDATGAGDSFCGALAYSIVKGWDLNKSIRFASAAGAIACLKQSSRASIPTINQVKEFIKKEI